MIFQRFRHVSELRGNLHDCHWKNLEGFWHSNRYPRHLSQHSGMSPRICHLILFPWLPPCQLPSKNQTCINRKKPPLSSQELLGLPWFLSGSNRWDYRGSQPIVLGVDRLGGFGEVLGRLGGSSQLHPWKQTNGWTPKMMGLGRYTGLVVLFIFFMITPTWGNDPMWLIFFGWVETTN